MAQETKRWTSSLGKIVNSDGTDIAKLNTACSIEEECIILIAPVAVKAIQTFVNKCNTGKLKLRSDVRELENVLHFLNI